MEVVLRDVTEGDLPILYEHQRDPAAIRMAAFLSRDEKAFSAHWGKILVDGNVTKKTILWGGRVVGNILSFQRSGKREVGYWIGREHWGKGIATEALFQFLRHEKRRPLHAVAARHNVASLRVLEKHGFVIVGELAGSPDARGPAVEELVLRLDATDR